MTNSTSQREESRDFHLMALDIVINLISIGLGSGESENGSHIVKINNPIKM